MEKIDQILESLYDRVIEPMEAKEQLLDLFAVSNRREQLIGFCEFYKNSKCLFEKWKVEEIVGLYLKNN